MSKSKIFVTVVLLLSFLSLFVSNSSAKNDNKKPKIQWSEEKLVLSRKSGDSIAIDLYSEPVAGQKTRLGEERDKLYIH